ncbi:hypothetical protein EUGRSUZ_H01865 [Eucalyptus grandis]|uniref:Uncharacterized protein n=2 Tax=Eucalyptus grandis TaxID=71139 RepID=A0A059AYZ1_EUCGR|nr:hypothetical protein EUGRSUZ_H01865 [Eucalyptus grandis]
MPDGSHAIYPKPRALNHFEIQDMVEHYRQVAINAIRAGKGVQEMASLRRVFPTLILASVLSQILTATACLSCLLWNARRQPA